MRTVDSILENALECSLNDSPAETKQLSVYPISEMSLS